MGRLKIVLLFAAIAATAQTASGQSQAANPKQATGPSSVPAYIVVGDVQNCDYYPLDRSTGTTIREAVQAAGLLNESSSVAVLRGTQEQAVWTQMISPGVSDSGEKVLVGDILVVQSMHPVKTEFRQNAALRTDAGVVIVALADESIAVGDVLQQTGNFGSAAQNVRISFRFQGRTPTVNATMTDRVFHGDVLSISQTSRRTLKGFGKMSPAFSEWSAADAAPSPVSAPAATYTQSSNLALPLQAPLQMPSEFEQNLAQPAEPVEPVTELSPTDSLSSNSASGLPVQPISQTNSPLTGDMPESIAPEPPVEIPIEDVPSMEQQPSGPGFWNLVFVGVLLVAGILILAGSLKPDEDNAQELAGRVEQSRGAIPPLTIFNGPLSSTSEIVTSPTVEPVVKERTVAGRPLLPHGPIAETSTASDLVPGLKTGLVAAHEWFGSEWRNQSSARPKVATPPAALPVMEAVSSREESEYVAPPAPVCSQVSFVNSATLTPSLPEVVDASVSICQPVAVSLKEMRPLQNETANGPHAGEQIDGLDELLQNRLPVDLYEAQLPLRVSLFGKAAGPRRLRIDAAHARVPAPHMNFSADRKREEPAVSAAFGRAADKSNMAETGSLDRALQNLQDRIDS